MTAKPNGIRIAPSTAGHALVVGTANLDVLASTEQSFDVIRKKGNISLSFGGAAHNIAINLKTLGMQPMFMGAMNDSAVCKMIRQSMRSQGITTHIDINEDLPDPIFAGQFHEKELITSISSSAIKDYTFAKDFIRDGVRGASCVIASTTMCEEAINMICQKANDMEVPFFLAINSEKRALKAHNINGEIEAVFINEEEMNFLQENTSSAKNWLSVVKKIGCQFLITQGDKGMTYIHPTQGEEFIPVKKLEIKGNTLGAGDLIVATTIYHHIFKKLGFLEAARKSFTDIPKILNQSHVHLGNGNALELNIKSVTQMAETDKLTGLLNRHGLENYYEAEGLKHQRFAAILIDLDHFKNINDKYGHNTGDEVLKSTSKTLKSFGRRGDAVGRWGGEEFVLLLVNASEEQAAKIAENIRLTIENSTLEALDNSNITISVGVTDSRNADSLESLIDIADQALYDAKEHGRNRVVMASEPLLI